MYPLCGCVSTLLACPFQTVSAASHPAVCSRVTTPVCTISIPPTWLAEPKNRHLTPTPPGSLRDRFLAGMVSGPERYLLAQQHTSWIFRRGVSRSRSNLWQRASRSKVNLFGDGSSPTSFGLINREAIRSRPRIAHNTTVNTCKVSTPDVQSAINR